MKLLILLVSFVLFPLVAVAQVSYTLPASGASGGSGSTTISDAVAVTRITMSGTLTLTGANDSIHHLDPDGSDRDVNLPDGVTGMAVTVSHVGSANVITVKESTGDGGATVTSLIGGTRNTLIHDGTEWVVY